MEEGRALPRTRAQETTGEREETNRTIRTEEMEIQSKCERIKKAHAKVQKEMEDASMSVSHSVSCSLLQSLTHDPTLSFPYTHT